MSLDCGIPSISSTLALSPSIPLPDTLCPRTMPSLTIKWHFSQFRTRLVKEHVGPPCVVLVINDNLYGLMCVLSCTCRNFPLASLGACVGFKVDEMRKRCVVKSQNAPSIEDIMFDACHPR